MEACLVRSRAEAMNGQIRASISILTPSPKRMRPQTDAHQSLLAPQRSPVNSSSPGNARAHDPLQPETGDSRDSIKEDWGQLGDASLRDERRTPDCSVEAGKRGSGGCSQPEERCDGHVRAGARDFDDPIEAEGRRSDGSTGEDTRNVDNSMIAQLSVSDDSVGPGVGRCNASIEAETRDVGVPMEVEIRTSASLENSAVKTKNPSSNGDAAAKKPKKKPVNVWAKSTSRKGGKKSSKTSAKPNSITKSVSHPNLESEQCVYIIPAKNQDKAEDGPGMPVVLSRFHKSEKIELSEDRLTAGSSKGYRMVRATRGVTGGAWFFEILIEKLGKTGHTRLGWSTQKGELQAPVGFDANSYGYRDVDGSKVHMAVREKYGERFWEGDVIGFYINLPGGEALAPKSASLVSYKGQPYVVDQREEPPKVVSGSEIAFFRNGVFQGVAFKDIFAGRYFPAASMYTLPNEPNCTVRFNFGPAFRFPPLEMGDDRPAPQALCNAPHCSLDCGPSWMSRSQGVNAGQTLEPYKTVEGGNSFFLGSLFECDG